MTAEKYIVFSVLYFPVTSTSVPIVFPPGVTCLIALAFFALVLNFCKKFRSKYVFFRRPDSSTLSYFFSHKYSFKLLILSDTSRQLSRQPTQKISDSYSYSFMLKKILKDRNLFRKFKRHGMHALVSQTELRDMGSSSVFQS